MRSAPRKGSVGRYNIASKHEHANKDSVGISAQDSQAPGGFSTIDKKGGTPSVFGKNDDDIIMNDDGYNVSNAANKKKSLDYDDDKIFEDEEESRRAKRRCDEAQRMMLNVGMVKEDSPSPASLGGARPQEETTDLFSLPCSQDVTSGGNRYSYVAQPLSAGQLLICTDTARAVGWPRVPQIGDYFQAREEGTKKHPLPKLCEWTDYCPNGHKLRTLVPNQLIGPVLEIRVIKYYSEKGKEQDTGIAVLVPSSEPEPGQRLTCVNVTYGKIPYARLITSQSEKSKAEEILANVRWGLNDGFDPTLDILWQVDLRDGVPICETWECANSEKSEGTSGPQTPMWRFVIRQEKNALASKVHPWRVAQRQHPRPQLPEQTTVRASRKGSGSRSTSSTRTFARSIDSSQQDGDTSSSGSV